MIEITKANIAEFCFTGEWEIASDVEGLKHRMIFVLDHTPATDVMQSSLKDKKINKQVGIRTHPEKYPAGILKVDYKGGRTTAVVTLEELAARSGMTPDEYLLSEIKRRGLVKE